MDIKGDDKQSDGNCVKCVQSPPQLLSLSVEAFADIICHCYALLAVECAGTFDGAASEAISAHLRSQASAVLCPRGPKQKPVVITEREVCTNTGHCSENRPDRGPLFSI